MIALLAGLEHEEDPPGELIATPREEPGRAREHGDVRVVAAGVHHAVDLGGERKPGIFVHGQRVHVGAQEDGRPRPRALQRGDHRREAVALARGQPQTVERLEDGCLRARQVQAKLGVAMDPAPEIDGPLEEAFRLRQQRRQRHGAMLRSAAEGRQRPASGIPRKVR